MTLIYYPGFVIASVLLALFAALVLLAYRTEAVRKASVWRWILGLLQYIVLTAVVVILWDPSRPIESQNPATNTVFAFFDTSRSMSVKDSDNLSRLNKALDVFYKDFGSGLTDRPLYRIFGFDRDTYSCDSVRSLHRWGEQTNLRSVFHTLRKYAPDPENSENPNLRESGIVGAVIFTDGQADTKSLDLYRPFDSESFKVAIVGIGSDDIGEDIAVRTIDVPNRALIDTTYRVEVTLDTRAVPNSEIEIGLSEDGAVAGMQRYVTTGPVEQFTVEFPLIAQQLGVHTLTVQATGPINETNLYNNMRSAVVEVVPDPRLKVLYYAQVASFDVGKIRQSLARDKKIDLEFRLDAVIAPTSSEAAHNLKLSASGAELYQYDIIVLDLYSMQSLTNTQVDALYRFVVNRGGGLVILANDYVEFEAEIWDSERGRSLLPIEMNAALQEILSGPRKTPNITFEGLHLLTKADPAAFSIETAAYLTQVSLKPAATTLMEINNTPLLCVHRVGRGRTCLVNVSRLHRWYREDLEGGLLRKLFSNITAYLGSLPQQDAGVELFAERIPEEPNNVRFSAFVFDSQFRPVQNAVVLLDVEKDVTRMDDVGEGKYLAEIPSMYCEGILVHVEAEQAGTYLGESTLSAYLPLPRSEMDNIQKDRTFMENVAQKIGATYIDVSDIDTQTGKLFPATRDVSATSNVVSVWRTWIVFLVLCSILTLIWFIRRAIGLV
ncbi:MAG: vWA domain-containing protein [bacterium]